MKRFILLLLVSAIYVSHAQVLRPGFDKQEYKELMWISARSTATPDYYNQFPVPSYKMEYQSKPIGLDNMWDFWTKGNNVAAISIRGTTSNMQSWLANLYAAMVPAKGEVVLAKNDTFKYELAVSPNARVHIGWLISMAYLSREIMPRIQEQYKKGTKDFIIVGHSQGGAISFLLTAYLRSMQRQGILAKDIQFKTYCSAAPKPGNLYFAYEYEAATQAGWAYNVVNAADWVPETPVSIQTFSDFNKVNPLTNAKAIIKKQKFPINLVGKSIYNQLDRSTRRAQRKYEKYLGKMAGKILLRSMKEYCTPSYCHSTDYVRTGNTIVLMPDEAYYKLYPDDPKNVFCHHLHKQYLWLVDKLP